MQSHEFNTGVIKPVDCMKEGWELIKSDYWLFFGITLVGLLIGGAVPIVLLGPMLCGIYICFLQKHDGRKPVFGDLFKGFDYFVPGLISSLIIVGISFVAVMIFLFIPYIILIFSFVAAKASGGILPLIGLLIFFAALFLFFVFIACLHALVVFTHLLIVDRKLSGWDAIRLSMKASRQNLGGVVGFIVVQFVLSFLGLLAFIVGAYLVLPIIYAGTTVMYRKIFPAIDIPPNINVPPSPANYPAAGFGQ
jgi:uncharacterized membrane protein